MPVGRSAHGQSIKRREVKLTPVQRSLIASHQRNSDFGHQNAALVVQFSDGVDIKRLASAFEEVVNNTDILRLQISPESASGAFVTDMAPATTKTAKQDFNEFATWAKKQATLPLDLEQSCYESRIVDHGDGTASWYINLHHVINDGSSAAFVLSAVESAYRGEKVERQDYFSHRFEASASEAAKAHWAQRKPANQISRLYKELTQDTTAASQMPVVFDGKLERLWNENLADKFRLITPRLTSSAFIVYLTALYIHRMSGEDTFSIGVVVNHRENSNSGQLIGPGFDMFPVDVRVEADDTHITLFRRVASSLLETLKNASSGASPAPDFNAVVNILPDSVAVKSFAEKPCSVSWLHSGSIDATYALRVMSSPYAPLEKVPGKSAALPQLLLDMKDAALGPATPQQAANHFTKLLKEALKNPEQKIGTISLCDTKERARIKQVGPSLTTKGAATINAMLSTALKGNESTVLVEGDEALSGDDVWNWACAIAEDLNKDKSTGSKRLGLLLETSSQAVVSIFGAVLAGWSFVPLDTKDPEYRTTKLIARAGITKVLSDIEAVNALRPNKEAKSSFKPARHAKSKEAYLLFTSGSSGEPKGVPITREGLTDYLHHVLNSYFENNRKPVAPLFGALKFDLTLTTLFGPILKGGVIHTYPGQARNALPEIARNPSINWMKATPSHLKILLQFLGKKTGVETLIVGGEAFSKKLANDLFERNSSLTIYNEYGPTEAVVGCVVQKVTKADQQSGTEIPIGHPIEGVSLLTMDAYEQPVPPGAAGELWISHRGVMQSYLDGKNPKEPLRSFEGKTYYRSGDLVRLNRYDQLEFLGRMDDQMKLNGVRVDPIEIEQALSHHPGIEHAVVRMWSPESRKPSLHCKRCGLPDNVPNAAIDDDGICKTCHSFEAVKDVTASWFRRPDDLKNILTETSKEKDAEYDCMHLLSGGKDSTFALYKLVEMGAKPYVLTLDNGFLSPSAKENIDRVVSDLGLTHEYATPASMNEIFRDSLRRHSNVCNGCYKSIYTMATARADSLGISIIFTGLSRGQLFETRLMPQQFESARFDEQAIDRAVVEARKVYHRTKDACSALPEANVFSDETVFDRVQYVDFYRYFDVELSTMMSYLKTKTTWKRPADTGRSTNCLINEMGIFTHLKEQGFHNYAIPYAWDVRLGHKTRDEAIAELQDELDSENIESMLAEIGYTPVKKSLLTAWYVTRSADIPTNELHAYLSRRLPAYSLPTGFVKISDIPITTNGKLDEAALPAPQQQYRPRTDFAIGQESEAERNIIAIWERELEISPISREDDFFALGGDSLSAIRAILALSEELGIEVSEEFAFTHTTPAKLATLLEASPEKNQSHQVENEEAATAPAKRHYDEQTPPELSIGEKAILFEHRSEPNSLRYNASRIYRLNDETFDPQKFAEALRSVIDLHVPLKWTYGARRKQIPADQRLDLTLIKKALSEAELKDRFRQIIDAPFDLENGPIARLAIATIDKNSTAILLVIHHIACDHESFDVLWQQASQVYETGELPIINSNYPSFASSYATRNRDESCEFWISQPLSAPSALTNTSPAIAYKSDGYISVSLDMSLADLNQGHRSPLAARGMAAAAIALSPHLIGSKVDLSLLMTARQNEAAKQLVGYLLNPVPFEIDCSGGKTFNEIIEDTGGKLARTIPHAHYPFPLIHAERTAAGVQAPSSRFLLSVVDHGDLTLNGNNVEQVLVTNRDAVTDATFFIQKSHQGLELSLEYRRAVFNDEAADGLLHRFRDAVSQIHTNPHVMARETEVADKPKSLLIAEPLDKFEIAYEAIVRQMKDNGDQLAVECGSEKLTWDELQKCSCYIANALEERNVGPNDLVAIALPRGCTYIASIIAIHSLGAGYIPLDLSNPQSRIDESLDIAKPKLVLQTGETNTIANGLDIADLRLEEGEWKTSRATLPDQLPDADATAYIIFTSGSTGTPKGVAISHRQLAHSNSARAQVYGSSPEQFLLLSSFAFDSSIVGIFWTLSAGGTLITLDDDEMHDPDTIIGALKNKNLSHTLCVPTLYKMMLQRENSVPGKSWPRTVILAGEALPPTLADSHFNRFQNSKLVNEYGPTEATVWSLSHELSANSTREVPIGKPIPGTWCAILGDDGYIAPLGTTGDLVLGGPMVADGYWRSQSDQNVRFIEGSKFDLPEGPAFKTGDKAVIKDGQVYFLGRLDDQLNIGGMRVEPGEIERAICAEEDVRDAVVMVHDNRTIEELLNQFSSSEQQKAFAESANSSNPIQALRDALLTKAPESGKLIAHLETDTDLDLTALRESLQANLPALLVPSLFEIHERFPTTATGKVDKTTLRSMDVSVLSKPAVSHQQPSPTSGRDLERLHALFVKTLQNPGFQTTDSFFVFGGNSLSALHLIFEIEEMFDIQIKTSALYKHPSPQQMLAHLKERGVSIESDTKSAPASSTKSRDGAVNSFALPIQLEGTKPPIIAIHTLGENGSIFADLARALGKDQPFWGVGENAFINMYGGWVSDASGPTAVPDVVKAYVDEIEELVPDGPIVLTGYCLGAQYAYELAQQLKDKGREPALLIMLHDLHAPERVRESQSELDFARAQRWEQIKQKKFATIPRLIKKFPDFAVRGFQEVKRQIEIKQLAHYKSSGKTLTKALSERDFVERSYVAAHAYENLPYDGNVLIVRRKDSSIYLDLKENNGWGNRLANFDIHELETDAFEQFLDGPNADRVARIIGTALSQKVDDKAAKSAVQSHSPEQTFGTVTQGDPSNELNFARGNENHQIRLTLSHDRVINSPRPEQRDWLVSQRLKELSEDLDYLDREASNMVAATGNLVVEGRDQAKLAPDEIMEDWQIPLMKKMAKIAAQNQGDVLEIGFGRGISASMIQSWSPRSHTIIEVNEHVIEDYQHWLKDFPNRDIKMVQGLWQDVLDQLCQYDGIMFHTYPLSSEEMVEILTSSCTFAEHFFPVAAKLLKSGGRFTYFTNDSDSISRTHQRALLEHFASFRIGRLTDLEIPQDSADAQWFSEIVVVEAIAK